MLDIPGYRVLGTIRGTGANVLFQAVREADGLPVLLKTPLAPSPGFSESERYRREFGILQRLRDVKGVARPYAYEHIHQRPVILLERVPGQSLGELAGKPLEVSQVLTLASSLAATLAEVHSRNVTHKDIKPSNIILEPSGEARLIDFGVATVQQVEHLEAVPSHLIEGTLAYMSPEQTGRMNRAVDYRTDFYSLGVTLYELLTGQRPFHGNDALEWFHAHMAQKPVPPHELNAAVPPVFSAIVLKLLAKVAEERYQSAEGLRADLEQCRAQDSQPKPEGFPLGTHDTPQRFQLPQRLYGRGTQVGALLQGFERVSQTARPELFLISGYSGIGKSSVVHELYKPVVERRSFFLSGKFDQFQRDIPYATLAQAIRGLVQQLLASGEEELARWREQLQQVWAGQGQSLVELVPQLEALVGRQPALRQLSASETQHRLHKVVRQFLEVFATPEHPLVMFLDDLQWADLSSLRLIQQLLSQPETPPVLWIGAYRDNEVSPSHPLVPVLEEVRKAGAKVKDIRLEPLDLEQVSQLVADALPGAGEELVTPLSALVLEKTGGNPFFLIQLMVTLNQDGLLVRVPGEGWRWNAEGVRAQGYSDNVVDFMVRKLRQLPERTQHLLRLAACVGNVFSLPMLGTLAGLENVAEVEQGLEPALQGGLLARSGLEQYRFLHDRIQQAAHSLSSGEESQAIHLRIGRMLLQGLTPEQRHEAIFDVVRQLSAGVELIREDSERHELARLNAEAGLKAVATVAHRPAITYLSAAFSLIPGDPWETDPELAFQVQLARARCEMWSGNSPGARVLATELCFRARNQADSVAAYSLKSDASLAVSDAAAAVAAMLECLARLGMPLPPHPTWEKAEEAHAEVWEALGERPIESLIDLPPMTDPHLELMMGALASLFGKAYVTDNNLFILCLSRMVSLTLRHGFTASATVGVAWFGLVTATSFKRFREGEAFSTLAQRLVDRHDLISFRPLVLLALQCTCYYTQPLPRVQELVLNAFQHALQTGDFYAACYCGVAAISNRLYMGHSLEEVHQDAAARAAFIQKMGVRDAESQLRLCQGFVRQLRGQAPAFGSLNGEGFDEASFEAAASRQTMGSIPAWYWIIKLQARFLAGAYREALDAADQVSELLWVMRGTLAVREFHCFRALTLAALFEEASPQEQQQSLEAMRRHQQQLAEWAEYSPGTFRAPERVVSAELARLAGRGEQATRLYEEAIRTAREAGATHHVALASELAANFWGTRQSPIVAHAFAREAWAAYQQWGAVAKVQQLETLWPHLAAAAATSPSDSSSSTTDSSRIDALTVAKTQQAISGEIVLERLVNTLMKAAIENAGAQRGALLLPEGDALTVAATSSVSGGHVAVLQGELLASELPWTLVSYVRRTREHVLIGDASRPHPFASDPYLARGGARSVLCLPLLRREQFLGALYLENNLATNAFNPSRLMLLGHIASQAAISIENARLYADVERARTELSRSHDVLEQRVEERTRELKDAQARLVDTARAVGMAEVASNVLHNVGNVLTSAVINLEMMQRAVGASRLGRLKQATTLLLEHREDLANFLAPNARGKNLPEYLAGLADELMGQQMRLLEDLEAMGRHIEHIRAIVQVQQTYARASLMAEDCDLGQLVEDALRIQLVALQRHGVALRRELSPVPRVKVDKHKVLQILINLISNAKYALDPVPEGERQLQVRLFSDGDKVSIQVTDNGVGIAPEVRDRLFAHGYTTRKEGHGFGLHSSALAAQMLGGRLTLDSEGPGKGAVATLELPLS